MTAVALHLLRTMTRPPGLRSSKHPPSVVYGRPREHRRRAGRPPSSGCSVPPPEHDVVRSGRRRGASPRTSDASVTTADVCGEFRLTLGPTDPPIVSCLRTIAKAGRKWFLAKEKLVERCLDAVRRGKLAGPCPDVKGAAKLEALRQAAKGRIGTVSVALSVVDRVSRRLDPAV